MSVGLENSARTLVKESDTTFENTSASLFRQSILDGDWENAFTALEQLQYEIKKKNKGMCFIQQLVSITNPFSTRKFRASILARNFRVENGLMMDTNGKCDLDCMAYNL